MAKKIIKKDKVESKFINYENLDKIGETAVYYGFQPWKSPEIKKNDIAQAKGLLDIDYVSDEEDTLKLPLHVEEKIAILRMYHENNLYTLSQPIFLYFKEPFPGSLKRNGDYNRYCDMEIIGGSRGIAESTLIQTARMILKEEGYENICVEINSIGDRDSMARFARDLNNYYRRHINDMHSECRQLLKKDPLELLNCKNDKCKKINSNAPHIMNFLGEASREHFQEVLEYLEALDIPYKINHNLIGNRKYCTETVFSIINMDYEKKSKDHRILAMGMRYDGLSRKIGTKKEIQGVGISLLIKGNRADLRKELRKAKKPFASFVQLGFESKLLSLSVVESLRQVKIPLCLSLAKDRLGAQVSIVEKNHIPYAIIMGKKEAIEKSVIVRNQDTHAQDIVDLTDLPKYMKKLETK
ncbi:MAG TPA: His/Gly/Thr/Pro-type tRNA ligase C-terminal domain-containing protein [Candidatus Paceibacterota bacterium]